MEQIAEQPWCNGRVAVWGVSYGGITALRAAASQPPHLFAAIAIEGSTNPYQHEVVRNDVPGLALILAEWATLMLAYNALPPVSGTPKNDVHAVHREHLAALVPWQEAWLDHPKPDAYWRGREVDPASIEVPTLIVTSWRDNNPAAAWQDYEAIRAPKKMVCGPWLHGLPDEATNHPINSIDLALVWLDTWVKTSHDSPDLNVDLFVLGSEHWETHERWPPQTTTTTLHLSKTGTLDQDRPSIESSTTVAYDATVGVASALGITNDSTTDQNRDDALSTVFESAPLSNSIDLIGTVDVDLFVVATAPETDVAIRVLDVAPDGHSSLISKGFQRVNQYETSTPAKHQPIRVKVSCSPSRYRIPVGHRIRLALAAADFPEVWPTSSPLDYDVLVGGPRGGRITLTSLTAPPSPATPFGPPNPSLARANQAELGGRMNVDEPSPGTVRVVGLSTMKSTTFDGQDIDREHHFEIFTSKRRPEQTELVTRTRLRVTGEDRRVEVETDNRAHPNKSQSTVRVLIDKQVVFSKAYLHAAHTPPS